VRDGVAPAGSRKGAPGCHPRKICENFAFKILPSGAMSAKMVASVGVQNGNIKLTTACLPGNTRGTGLGCPLTPPLPSYSAYMLTDWPFRSRRIKTVTIRNMCGILGVKRDVTVFSTTGHRYIRAHLLRRVTD